METAFRLRLYLLTALILLGFGALLHRLHKVQIEDQQKYKSLLPSAKYVSVREPGVRGEIRDSHGVILARNSRHYEVTFNIDEIVNYYKLQHDQNPIREVLKTENGMPRKGEKRNIPSIVQETIIARLAEYGLDKKYDATSFAKALEIHYATHGGLVPFSYRTDLTNEQFARFAELNLSLPGVYIGLRPQRQYPYNTLACHILGYTKEWEKGDVPEEGQRQFDHYIGEEKGIAGIEATMDKYLKGSEGIKTILKDEKGRVVNMTDYTKPQTGADITLTIDAKAQYLVENVLRRAGRAAAVVMDVNTGKVIAMASVPNYDSNNFIPSIAPEKWLEYSKKNICLPLMNRATEGFDPGSTFKLATALAGARAGLGDRIYSCNGYVQYGNHKAGCWIWNQSKGMHGSENISTAIKQSCNPYFFRLANAVGPQGMADTFTMLNLGRTTGIELPSEKPGMVIGSAPWKHKYPSTSVTPVDTAFLAIGQGVSAASPLQLCALVSCIANGGKYYQPRLVKTIIRNGQVIVPDEPKLMLNLLEKGVSVKDMDRIRKGMWMAVNEPGGTAGRVKMPNIEAGGKTGTAQSMDRGKKSNNSWTVTFAPFDKPKYAICVLVVGGKSGGKVAGPLAHLIYRGLFAQDDGLSLPLHPQNEVKGNTDMIEEIKLPEDTLAAVEATETTEITETAENVQTDIEAVTPTTNTEEPTTDIIPTPTLTPDIDPSGTIPRARPVEE
jgi:penicillin-binding protein 2